MATTNGRPTTYVVGVDHSPESEQAVAWVRSLAAEHDRIVLVHAWQMPVVAGYDMVVTVDPYEIEQAATRGLDELVERLADERLIPVVHQGHAGRALITEAVSRDAALIAVGHRGHSRVSMMLGSTANYVLHHTTRPVVVVRGTPGDAIRRIVVGADDHGLEQADTNPSVRSVQWAFGVPGVEHVQVVHAWFLPALAIGMFADVSADLEAMDAAATAVVDHVIAAAGPPPDRVTVTGEAVRGTPGFGLIEASRDADLVVVGSRGRGGFAGLVLGSTTTETVAHAHCPVVVIR